VGDVEEWSFGVLADWHGAESFAHNPDTESKTYIHNLEVLSHINFTYGGDLFLLPGDMETGNWNTQEWIDKHYPGHTPQEAVLYAGSNCYTTARTLFAEAGYDKILVAVGDHELGDNYWAPRNSKTTSLPQFRQSFAKALYTDQVTEKFLYNEKIGNAEPTPYHTVFEHTSFAHQHKNVLFVTVDSFVQISDNVFINREMGIGGEGVVTGDVKGAHLKWFKRVLIEAQKITSIKHIVVQSHLPVLSPVQKVASSAMSFDRAERSSFWKLMVKYGVDLYLAGEVHANTATKDANSNLVQIVSRGNRLTGFLKVHVTEGGFQVFAYNEAGPEFWNKNYVVHGELTVNKDVDELTIMSSGALKLLDTSEPLIHFSFEETSLLSDRPILGLNTKKKLKPRGVEIRGIYCVNVMRNYGVFGQQYDAQVANVGQVTNGGISGHAGNFNDTTRMSIFSLGPQAGGQVVSYAIWFKTVEYNSEMILVHYDKSWGGFTSEKNTFTLTLNNGTPMVYADRTSFLKPDDDYRLNDGKWHHVAVSMIRRSCLLSEVNIFIDGINIPTTAQNDLHIFAMSYGHISLGGPRFSFTFEESNYPNWRSFTGMMDDFYLWGRVMEKKDLLRTLNRTFLVYADTSCSGDGIDSSQYTFKGPNKCKNRCSKNLQCFGYKNERRGKKHHRCTHFKNKRPIIEFFQKYCECGLVKFWNAETEVTGLRGLHGNLGR